MVARWTSTSFSPEISESKGCGFEPRLRCFLLLEFFAYLNSAGGGGGGDGGGDGWWETILLRGASQFWWGGEHQRNTGTLKLNIAEQPTQAVVEACQRHARCFSLLVIDRG
jgi:hypothetical protein